MSLWAAPAALGFALFFNVRRRTLLPIAVLAIMAHMLRTLMQDAGQDLVSASFVAALAVGIAAYTIGPATGEASPVYAFAPVIPLVPGTLFFDGLAGLAESITTQAQGAAAAALLADSLNSLISASGVVLALAIGATAPMLFLPQMRTAAD